MARKTTEEEIREVSTSELKYRLEHKREDYTPIVFAIMNNELIQRKIKQENPIEQVKIIKHLSNDEIEHIVTQSKHSYTEALYKIILNEYNSRDLEKEQWFYLSNNNETLGPVKFRDLKKLLEDNVISEETLIVKEGFTDWVSASGVAGLFENDNSVQATSNLVQTQNQNLSPIKTTQYQNDEEKLGCGLSLLSFLIPIIGAIMFLAYPNKKGRAAGQLALFGFIVDIILVIAFYY